MLDKLNSDLVLQTIQYLNVAEGGNLASASKRYYYLVHKFRIFKGPDLVAATSSPGGSSESGRRKNLNSNDMLSKAISKLQSPPNFAFAFNTGRSALADTICQSLPKDAVVLGAVSSDIESNCDGEIGCKSNASVMFGNLPSATVKPFCLENQTSSGIYRETTTDICVAETNELLQQLGTSNASWKVFLVYGCGDRCMVLEDFISRIQNQYPDAVIVGGICSSGYVSQELSQPPMMKEELSRKPGRELKYMIRMLGGKSDVHYIEKSELVDYVHELMLGKKHILNQVDDAIFGVALGGDVPVRSVVSRGVRSVAPSASSFVIQEATFVSGNEENESRVESPCHLIHSIREEGSGKTYSFTDLFRRLGNLDFIGLQRPGSLGFELHPIYNFIADSLLIPDCRLLKSSTDDEEAEINAGSSETQRGQVSSLIHKRIGFFALDSDACVEHMAAAIKKLRLQTKDEEILGSVMFSCNGRDPSMNGGLIPRAMRSDAARFAEVFPDVPCLGFYAGGEIGPIAMAGETDTCSVFQTGKVALQGFTVVFALFIVPVVDLISYNLDDCEENVSKFIKSRLQSERMVS